MRSYGLFLLYSSHHETFIITRILSTVSRTSLRLRLSYRDYSYILRSKDCSRVYYGTKVRRLGGSHRPEISLTPTLGLLSPFSGGFEHLVVLFLTLLTRYCRIAVTLSLYLVLWCQF